MSPGALLAGVAVVEAGAGDAVAIAGRLLADAGADVRKVRPADWDRGSPWARALEAGKRIALTSAPLAPLLAAARIVLLGEEDPSLAGLDGIPSGPTVVVVRASDGRPTDDLLAQAEGGIAAGIGEPMRPPLKLPLDQTAHQAALAAAIAATASLFAAPARIDVTPADVWKTLYSGPAVAMARFGRARTRRAGHRALRVPWPRTIVPCKDGYFAVQCATREHWLRFLDLTGRRDLEDAPLFADRVKANDEHGDEAEALFAPWFAARTKAELVALFLAARIPGAPVYTIDEVAAHPHLRERDAFRACADAKTLAVNLPFRLVPAPPAPLPAAPAAAPRAAHTPLEGVRVVDFGWVWAGAVPGSILAGLGAEVIKVETMTHLDYMRQGRPIVGTARDPEQNPMFAAVNRDKRSLRIDMTAPEGAQLLRELVAASDVVIENFTPGVLARHGLGWDDLVAARPGLVMCSMSAAGATGPLRDIRTYATMIAGLCGLDAMVGYPEERVLGSQSSYADPNASLHATFAILAAHYRRAQTGAGAWIDLSQWQAGAWAMGQAVAEWAAGGTVPGPSDLMRSPAPIYGTFPSAGRDAWVALVARDQADWAALCAVLENPAALVGADLRLDPARARAALAAATAQRPAAELADALRDRGIAAAVVGPEHLSGDALFEDLPHPVLGAVPVYRLPWRIDGAYPRLRKRAPLMGEDNARVLNEILKLPGERVAALDAAGIFT